MGLILSHFTQVAQYFDNDDVTMSTPIFSRIAKCIANK